MSTFYALHAGDLPALLTAWARESQVLCPQKEDKRHVRLASCRTGEVLTLEYVNLPQPPSDVLNGYPDVFFHWKGKDGGYSVTPGAAAAGPLTLFGVRPCDATALEYLDSFYLGEYQDINYSLRRAGVSVVALNCLKPGENCFCPATGSGPFAARGADMVLTPDGERFVVECVSGKGEALLGQGAVFFQPLEAPAARARLQALEKAARAHFHDLPDLGRMREAALAGFELPLWDELAATCISCTGCTAVCPTCTCFQFKEQQQGAHAGKRVRVKDSCQTAGFTRNAGGHNPRDKRSIVRYRLLDKLVYIEERFHKKGCVGCGRCITACPSGIDIRAVGKALAAHSQKAADVQANPVTAPAVPPSVAGTAEAGVMTPQRGPTRVEPGLYAPHPARILAIEDEAPGIRRYTVRYVDESLANAFQLSGQFFMLTVFGVGEVALSVPFGDQHQGTFEFCVKKVGKVTSALNRMRVGDVIGLRGPYGRGFPFRAFSGRDVLLVGSGVGLAPVRTIIVRLLQDRQRYGRIAIIASATTYEGLIYKQDLRDWSSLPGVSVQLALARPTDQAQAHVGYINDLLPGLGFDWKRASAILCASPKRIRLVAEDLLALGMAPEDIQMSLETHMRCGVGKCGHCKVGSHYVCQDGPVFTYAEVLQLPEEF